MISKNSKTTHSRRAKYLAGALASLILMAAQPAIAQKKTQSARTDVYSAQEELAGFKLAEGFVIELVASQEDGVVNPIDLTFDDAGRLWTQTARMYPLDPVADIKWNELIKLMDDPEARGRHPAFKRIRRPISGKNERDGQNPDSLRPLWQPKAQNYHLGRRTGDTDERITL